MCVTRPQWVKTDLLEVVFLHTFRNIILSYWLIRTAENDSYDAYMPTTLMMYIFVGLIHYTDVIMSAMASRITSLTIVYSTVYSGTDERKHRSFASLAFVWGIRRGPVNFPHKRPVTRKMFPFIMFDTLAQGNAYKPTKEPTNYHGPGGDRTHNLQIEATPPDASGPARSLHATEIV